MVIAVLLAGKSKSVFIRGAEVFQLSTEAWLVKLLAHIFDLYRLNLDPRLARDESNHIQLANTGIRLQS